MSWTSQTCRYCGDRISFVTTFNGPIPIHESGSCTARSGWSSYSGYGSGASMRVSNGVHFEFPFTAFPSYVNPNARCPVCCAEVYFYQSPYGGRVFFDDLGPPWPKHPCTDHPKVQAQFGKGGGYSAFLIGTTPTLGDAKREPSISGHVEASIKKRQEPEWVRSGWMPFIVKRVTARQTGLEAFGDLCLSADKRVPIRIWQSSADAVLEQQSGEVVLGFNFITNASMAIDALNESPVLMRLNTKSTAMEVSTFLFRETITPLSFQVNFESGSDPLNR